MADIRQAFAQTGEVWPTLAEPLPASVNKLPTLVKLAQVGPNSAMIDQFWSTLAEFLIPESKCQASSQLGSSGQCSGVPSGKCFSGIGASLEVGVRMCSRSPCRRPLVSSRTRAASFAHPLPLEKSVKLPCWSGGVAMWALVEEHVQRLVAAMTRFVHARQSRPLELRTRPDPPGRRRHRGGIPPMSQCRMYRAGVPSIGRGAPLLRSTENIHSCDIFYFGYLFAPLSRAP